MRKCYVRFNDQQMKMVGFPSLSPCCAMNDRACTLFAILNASLTWYVGTCKLACGTERSTG
jgi:hypothetical protein